MAPPPVAQWTAGLWQHCIVMDGGGGDGQRRRNGRRDGSTNGSAIAMEGGSSKAQAPPLSSSSPLSRTSQGSGRTHPLSFLVLNKISV
jgi:hypothetical protein